MNSVFLPLMEVVFLWLPLDIRYIAELSSERRPIWANLEIRQIKLINQKLLLRTWECLTCLLGLVVTLFGLLSHKCPVLITSKPVVTGKQTNKQKTPRFGLEESNYSPCNNCFCYSSVFKTLLWKPNFYVSTSSS